MAKKTLYLRGVSRELAHKSALASQRQAEEKQLQSEAAVVKNLSGEVQVHQLTIHQIESFYKHGIDLYALVDVLKGFHFNHWSNGLIEGMLPWCNLYGGMTPDGQTHT